MMQGQAMGIDVLWEWPGAILGSVPIRWLDGVLTYSLISIVGSNLRAI